MVIPHVWTFLFHVKKMVSWSGSFFCTSDVKARRKRQLLRLLPLEIRRKVKNNMLQLQSLLMYVTTGVRQFHMAKG